MKMEEKTEKKQPEKKGLEQLPSGIEEVKKLHGARQSKVDPGQMTLMQHEEAKLRIFKRIMILLGVFVVLGVGYAIYSYYVGKKADEAYIAGQKEKLALLEATFSKETPEKIYTSAVNAAEATRIAENLIVFSIDRNYPELRGEMEAANEKYRKVMQESSPVNHQPFVASTVMLDMVPIKEGKFLMGDSRDLAIRGETPCVEITITKPFWISRYEITNRQFRHLTPAHITREWNHRKLNGNEQPAAEVSWDEAMLFCKALTDKERKLGRVPEGYEYRLPTEAEWEYVCRAGKTTDYYWGNDFGTDGAMYANGLDIKSGKTFNFEVEPGAAPEDGFEVSAPVGSFKPNDWGIYDMSGNVGEWCYDYYAPNTYIILQNAPDRKDPCNTRAVVVKYEQLMNFDAQSVVREIPCKVIRGGNWGCSPEKLRSAARLFMPQNEKNNGVGFRPVLAPIIKNSIGNTIR